MEYVLGCRGVMGRNGFPNVPKSTGQGQMADNPTIREWGICVGVMERWCARKWEATLNFGLCATRRQTGCLRDYPM